MVWATCGVPGIIGPFFVEENVPQFVDWAVLPSFLQAPYFGRTSLQAGWVPNSLVPACDGMVQSELGWPMHRKMWFSRHTTSRGDLVHLIWLLWIFICRVISRGRFMEKLPKLGKPQELNLSSFSRRDDRKCVSKREELGEETEIDDWAWWCSRLTSSNKLLLKK